MDSGRFTILLVLIFALGGGSFYYSYTQVDLLKAQIASVNARIDPVQTNAINAGKLANSSKVAADAATAAAAKANASIDQINAAITALQTKPAPAAAPAKKK